jgi:TRAP-type C4-dicarboxylate transport system permease small subunit
MKTDKATRITRYAFLFLLISIVTGIINRILVGSAKTPLTVLVGICVISFMLFMILIGIDVFMKNYRKGITSTGFVVTCCVIISGVSFLTIFINSPIMGNDLNGPVSSTMGILFMISVIVALFYRKKK